MKLHALVMVFTLEKVLVQKSSKNPSSVTHCYTVCARTAGEGKHSAKERG